MEIITIIAEVQECGTGWQKDGEGKWYERGSRMWSEQFSKLHAVYGTLAEAETSLKDLPETEQTVPADPKDPTSPAGYIETTKYKIKILRAGDEMSFRE